MYNPQSYAISIERLLKASTHSADTIRKNPLAYVSSYLDSLSKQSEDKRQLVFDFDDKYEKYKNVSLDRWEETDAAQMLKDLRELIK